VPLTKSGLAPENFSIKFKAELKVKVPNVTKLLLPSVNPPGDNVAPFKVTDPGPSIVPIPQTIGLLIIPFKSLVASNEALPPK